LAADAAHAVFGDPSELVCGPRVSGSAGRAERSADAEDMTDGVTHVHLADAHGSPVAG
jgi:hypothetical protein